MERPPKVAGRGWGPNARANKRWPVGPEPETPRDEMSDLPLDTGTYQPGDYYDERRGYEAQRTQPAPAMPGLTPPPDTAASRGLSDPTYANPLLGYGPETGSGSGATLGLKRAADGSLSWAGGGISAEALALDRQNNPLGATGASRVTGAITGRGGALTVMPMPWGGPTPEETARIESAKWLDAQQAAREQARLDEIRRATEQQEAKRKFQIGTDAAAHGRSAEAEEAAAKAAEQAIRSKQAIAAYEAQMKSVLGQYGGLTERPTDPTAAAAWDRMKPQRDQMTSVLSLLHALDAALRTGGDTKVTQTAIDALAGVYNPRVAQKYPPIYTTSSADPNDPLAPGAPPQRP